MSIKNIVDGLHLSPAWSHLNLTVHPLLGAPSSTLSYLTLDEALATGRFRLGEISMRGSVPELKVSNGLPKSVLLLDGQELIGAKQNRVLNLTIMIPAHTEMTIPVSCVEAGRWRHVSDTFMAADLHVGGPRSSLKCPIHCGSLGPAAATRSIFGTK